MVEPKILFENENYLALDKPAGLLVHTDEKIKEGRNNTSLTDWLGGKYPQLENIGGAIEIGQGRSVKRWGLVHRIDRETSGIIILAKNEASFQDLQNKFQNREVKKTYYAFVYGRVTADHDVIDVPIGRSKTDFRRFSTGRDARGELREAVTEYRVMHKTDEVTFLEILPKTGRTHQIRVHLRSIGHPIIGDPLYAANKKLLLGFERLALHAEAVSFQDINGNEMVIHAPFPIDFKNAFKMLGIEPKTLK